MRVGGKDEPDAALAEHSAKVGGWIRVVHPAPRDCAGVDLDDLPRRGNRVRDALKRLPIPCGVLVEIRMLRVELPHEVEVADDIEVELLGHLALLPEIGAYVRLDVSAEVVADPVGKRLGRLVYADMSAVRRRHEMDGADDVVGRDERIRRAVGVGDSLDIVGLDAAEDADAAGVLLGEGAYLRRVCDGAPGVERPVEKRAGEHGVRRKADFGESLFDCGEHDLLRRVRAVAPDGVGVVVRHGHLSTIQEPGFADMPCISAMATP